VYITVNLARENTSKTINLQSGSTVDTLLKKMDLKPDTLIVTSDNQVIPVDDTLSDGQEITIILVSSGG
jgi:sulfur carrier protein ThiS